jgi:octaprenyl-diphosphate synthase
MEVGTHYQKELVKKAIESGEADFDAVAQAIHDTGALEHAQRSAVAEADMARQALDAFPESVAKAALLAFCTFATERDR